ncbi:hypothetical protein POM88_049557 [Heracleum sosnowskyi]|uniref:Uncharacterized protein n=1 Tax=Heracleum sosnowskyi TaxID=360622 RepID=A0AAD8GX25_9APIA|nr:hypothetical protein POM88_049557 [Heracleum sosnowskyi]
MFKINFLTVLSNVLIGTPTHSYIDKYFVKFESLDKYVSYNWADFLIEYLVTGKESWNRTGSEFFRGSQIFLTLLYVDHVRHKGKTLVERRFPSFRGWTEEKLKERLALEDGEFGSGKILCPLREHFSQDSQSEKSPSPNKNCDGDDLHNQEDASNEWNECQQDFDYGEMRGNDDATHNWNEWQQHNHENQRTDAANDDGQWGQHHKGNDDDQWPAWPSNQEDDLSYVEWEKDTDNVNQEDDLSKEMEWEEDADNVNIEDDECETDITDISEEGMMMIQKKCASENFNEQRQEDVIPPDAQTMDQPIDEFDLDPKVLDQLEIIEYLHSEQGIKDMTEVFSSEKRDINSNPSFSLGPEIEILSQEWCDNNKENETDVETDDFITPKPEM